MLVVKDVYEGRGLGRPWPIDVYWARGRRSSSLHRSTRCLELDVEAHVKVLEHIAISGGVERWGSHQV